jgi:hypothetical protein
MEGSAAFRPPLLIIYFSIEVGRWDGRAETAVVVWDVGRPASCPGAAKNGTAGTGLSVLSFCSTAASLLPLGPAVR